MDRAHPGSKKNPTVSVIQVDGCFVSGSRWEGCPGLQRTGTRRGVSLAGSFVDLALLACLVLYARAPLPAASRLTTPSDPGPGDWHRARLVTVTE